MFNPENIKQQFEESHSRRRFVKWMGQIAAGASLATIGLGITNPLDALAASKKAAVPNCYQCPPKGYQDVVCYFSVSCYPHGNCAREILTYQGGCVSSPDKCPVIIQQAGCCGPGTC